MFGSYFLSEDPSRNCESMSQHYRDISPTLSVKIAIRGTVHWRKEAPLVIQRIDMM